MLIGREKMNIKDIAKRLKELRIKNNLTQEELADKMYLTRQAVSRWEKEKSLPDYTTLELLSKEYNVSLDYILFGKKETKKKNIKEIYLEYLLSLNKKKRIITIITSIVIAIILLFSIHNMIMYYGKVNVYEFSYRDDKISCTNAYLFITNQYCFIKYCDITLTDQDELFEREEYYIQTKDKKRLIVSKGVEAGATNRIPIDNINKGDMLPFSINSGEYVEKNTIFYKKWDILVKIKTNKNEYTFILNKEKTYQNNGNLIQFLY
jgi:transcriptional regulator with XRE-family HTH domain